MKGLAAHYCDRVWGNRDEPDLGKLDTESLERSLKFRRDYGKDDPDRNTYGDRQKLVGQFHKALFGTTDVSAHHRHSWDGEYAVWC